MKKYNFYDKGNILIGIVITLVAASLVSGGLYYYFSKQIPEMSQNIQKLNEEVVKSIEVNSTPEKETSTTSPEDILPTPMSETSTIQKCFDGTFYDQCSVNTPKYCDSGNLIDKCESCGCGSGQRCHFLYFSNTCIKSSCNSDQDCNDNKEQTIDSCTFDATGGTFQFTCKHKLTLGGNPKIAIVEFQTQGINYSSDFLQNMNNKEIRKIPWGPYKDPWSGKEFTESIFSFYYLEDFLEQEAQRYGKNVAVSVNILGPYTVSQPVPQRKGIDDCDPTMGDYFDQQVANINLNFSGYDAIAFVYFSNGENAFYSCKGENAYVAAGWVELEGKGFTNNAIFALFHETAHLFGASDSYRSYACNYPYGFIEPNRNPLYPQLEACLMCGNVPIAEKSSRSPADISEVKICPKTAEEIGLK